MGASCSIDAHCRNSKGEVVVSKLWKNLLHYLSNRGLTKEYYAVGTNEEFLDKVRDEAEFDENNQIEFSSLKKLANINVEKEKILKTLNSDIQSGTYTYEEAITKLQEFNRENPYNDQYLATIQSTEDGKYELSVVEKSSTAMSALEKEIKNRSLQDRIKYYLNKNGVDVSFLDEDSREFGRYSTVNAEKTASGLYNLIKVAKGEKLEEALAEEAGHFAVASLGNSPLVQRLMGLLNVDVQKEILGSEYENKRLGKNPRREVAGYLVGQAIANNIDKRGVWSNLANRIKDLAKRVYAHMKGDDILKAKLMAEKYAGDIARGFMSSDFTGDVETALKTEETLYDAPDYGNVRVYGKVISDLKDMVLEMKTISPLLYNKFNAMYRDAARMTGFMGVNADIYDQQYAMQGIVNTLMSIADELSNDIAESLDEVDLTNPMLAKSKIVENAKVLRTVRTFINHAGTILSFIQAEMPVNTPGLTSEGNYLGMIDGIVEVEDIGTGDHISVNINSYMQRIEDSITSVAKTLELKEKAFFLQFLEDSYGSKYIRETSRIIWNKRRTDKKDKKGILDKYDTSVDKSERSISDYLDKLDPTNELSLQERFIGAMADASDPILQIIDKVSKAQNKVADDLAFEFQDELKGLRVKLKEECGLDNTDLLCERSYYTGELTGNIIQEVNWGDWEANREEKRREINEGFMDYLTEEKGMNEDTIRKLSDYQKGILYGDYAKDLWKEWHKENSIWNKESMSWMPKKDVYRNKRYEDLIRDNPNIKVWLNSYMELKSRIDSLLPEGSTTPYRLPQFKGSFSNRMRNRKLSSVSRKDRKFSRRVNKGIRESLREAFCEDALDTEFGSDNFYTTKESDVFGDEYFVNKEKPNRVPLYGINKLEDMSQLCTDFFNSTFAYAGMAATYAGTSSIVDALEIGTQVLGEREFKGKKEKELGPRGILGKGTFSFTRYVKFLDKQVYGVGTHKVKLTKTLVLNKIMNVASAITSKMFLGGNIKGAIVNTGTGQLELIKEAFAGEYFNLKDLHKAQLLYMKHISSNVITEWGKADKDDFISLFMKHFNTTGDNKQAQREWNTRKNRIANFYGHSLFLPYKSGDIWMHTITYLALAMNTKLYDEYGNEVNLLDAYQRQNITYESKEKDSEGRNIEVETGKKKLALNGVYFKSIEDKRAYDLINSIISKIEASIASGPLSRGIDLTTEEANYLDEHGYDLADTETVLENLKKIDLNEHHWGQADESEFMDKAREINIRMHGIYNSQDAVTLAQTWYGKILLSMRGYALGMLERRFGKDKYSIALGQQVEGSLNTGAKYYLNLFTKTKRGFMEARSMMDITRVIVRSTCEVFYFSKSKMMSEGFSEHQYRNMRRNFADGIMIGLLMCLRMLTALGKSDDKDEDGNLVLGWLYYITSRLESEQYAFNSIKGFKQEIPQLATLSPVAFSGMYKLYETGELALGALTHDVNDSDYFFQRNNPKVLLEKGAAKFWYSLMSISPWIKDAQFWGAPYKARESYYYGIKQSD
jgi:hypothetical protein